MPAVRRPPEQESTQEVAVITVLVADDHAFVWEALVDLFAHTEDIEVVAACSDGAEAVDTAQRTRRDVVLMDMAMPRMNGLEATRALLELQPQARVLMLTGTFSAAAIQQPHSLGVRGYVLKDDDPADLIDQIRAVAAGGTAWSPSAEGYLRTHN
jgi:DNA-binding NarL/FixJ family response regulator